jgi:hypothetical protein
MIDCDVERLEALIEGALPAEDAAETRAHLAACARCEEELRWLRDERRLLRARAETATPAVPPFAAVLAEVRREAGPHAPAAARPRRLRDHAPWLGLAAAAALALVVTSRSDPPPRALAEPLPSFICYDDPQSLVAEATAYATDRAVASAEDLYGACLVATPCAALACGRTMSAGLTGPLPATRPAAMMRTVVESDVTYCPLGPPDEEVFESRTRGVSYP